MHGPFGYVGVDWGLGRREQGPQRRKGEGICFNFFACKSGLYTALQREYSLDMSVNSTLYYQDFLSVLKCIGLGDKARNKGISRQKRISKLCPISQVLFLYMAPNVIVVCGEKYL